MNFIPFRRSLNRMKTLKYGIIYNILCRVVIIFLYVQPSYILLFMLACDSFKCDPHRFKIRTLVPLDLSI